MNIFRSGSTNAWPLLPYEKTALYRRRMCKQKPGICSFEKCHYLLLRQFFLRIFTYIEFRHSKIIVAIMNFILAANQEGNDQENV